MSEFYATILAVDASFIGLVTASLLVYLELVTSHYSYRLPNIVFRDRGFKITLLISALALIGATNGLIGAAYPKHDLVPLIHLNVRSLLYVLGVTALSVLELTLALALLIRFPPKLSVPNIVREVIDKIEWNDLKDYLLAKHGLPEQASIGQRIALSMNFEKAPQIQGNDTERAAELREHLEGRIASIENPVDPFAPLTDAAVAAINRHDREGWRVSISTLKSVFEDFLDVRHILKDQESEIVGDCLPKYLAREIVRQVTHLRDVCIASGHPSTEADIVDLTATLALKAVSQEWTEETTIEYLQFLEAQAEVAIRQGKELLLSEIVDAVAEIVLAGIQIPSRSKSIIEALRSLGEIAGILIYYVEIPVRSSFIASRRTASERLLSSLVEAFGKVTQAFLDTESRPEVQQHLSILARVIEELIRKTNTTIATIAEDRQPTFYQEINWLTVDIQNIARDAAENGNAFRLERACKYLTDLYAFSNEVNDPAELCASTAIELAMCGAYAVPNNKDISGEIDTTLIRGEKSLVGIVMNALQTISPYHLYDAMNEVFTESSFIPETSRDEVASVFIQPMVRQMGNNFGLPYDRETGEHL